jgi:hypothetical protein
MALSSLAASATPRLTPGAGASSKPFVSGLTLIACNEMDSPTKSHADLAQAMPPSPWSVRTRSARSQVVRGVAGWRDFFETLSLEARPLDRISSAFRDLADVTSP